MLPARPRLEGRSMSSSARASSSRMATRVSSAAPSMRISRATAFGSRPLVDQPSHPDVQHKTQAQERAGERRAPVAHQGERDAGGGKKPDDHTNVEQRLSREHADDADG